MVLTVYASLYPLEGWHNHGLSPLAYLDAPWPRYITAFDLAVNLLGYMPYGFLCVAALEPRQRLSILELEGLGKEIWEGIDAAEHVRRERDSWD